MDHMVVLVFFFFAGNSILFFIVAALIYISTNRVGGFPFSTSLPIFVICRLYDDRHSDWCELIPHYGFDLHFSNN